MGDARRVLAAPDRDGPGGRPGGPRASTSTQLADWRRDSEASLVARLRRLARGPADRGLRGRADRRADRASRHLRRRRRPEPDVARALHRIPRAEPPRQLGRPGHHGLTRSRRRWARRSATPTRETWAITGDGGFQMTFQELMTLVADQIPVKIALLDNKKLGMIRQWQEIIYAGNYHSSQPARARLRQARRGLRDPGLPGEHAGRGRPGDPGRAGRRRPGAHLVRDRRGTERLPDDAGGQGPVRPDREVGRGRRMSDRLRPAPTSRATGGPTGATPPVRARCPVAASASPRPGRDRPRQAGRAESRVRA